MKFEAIKALVWREWRLTRKSYLSMIGILIIVAAWFWLIRLSMSVGNLAPVFGDSEILTEFGGILYYAAVTLIGAIALMMTSDASVLQADINANWLRYSFALPITPAMRASAHTVTKIIKLLIGFILAVVNAVLTAKVMDIPFTGDMLLFLTAMLAAVIVSDTFQYYFYTKARSVRGLQTAQIKSIGLISILIMGCAVYRIVFKPNTIENADINVMVDSVRTWFISRENIIIPLSVIGIIGGLLLGWFFIAHHYRTFGDVDEKKEAGVLFTLLKKKGGEET